MKEQRKTSETELSNEEIANLSDGEFKALVIKMLTELEIGEDGGEIGGSRVHFPSTPVKYLADLRSRVNSQRYSSIYEDRRPKIEDIERSDGKKSASGQ